eukprot:s6245_g2.t1
MKTRVPQIRTQESFAHGTASVHVELLIPQSVALSAVLSEQVPVKVSSFLASATECETNGGRRGRRRATHVLHITSRVQFSVGIRQLQVSGWTCSPLSETHAIRRSAASSLRPGAAPKNRASRCASSQEPVLQDGFRSMRSSLLGVLSQASAAFGINLLPWTLRCCNCNVYLCPGRDVCKVCQRCVLHGWAADHKNAIVVDMSSWMSSVLSGAPEISRSAASSLRPGTAPGNCACQCTSQEPVLQRRFRSIRFRLLGLLGQASAACGIDVFPCAFVVTSTLSSAGQAEPSSKERDPSRSLRPVRVARKKDPVLRSSGSVAPPSPMKSMPLSPSPLPSAAWVLRLQGAVRSVFRPDIEEAVEANCLVISPVDETLSQAQVPFILMIRHLFSLLPSHALQDREVLLNLVLVGHSHGGVVGHSLTQSLECAGFLVKGIVAVDTLGLPRWSGMPLPRFDPQGLIRNLSPYHWQLTAPTVNMMAPEVPRLFLLFPLCEFPDGIPSSFLSL